ncbi:MAG: alkaline phosphatase [Lewinellaceae bacterium]|nr:alkaline phosphatase [Lewinellaceae bacterium]
MKGIGAFSLLLSTLFFFSCQSTQRVLQAPVPAAPLADKPHNVVLLIGDGMGLTQISAAMYSNNNQLFLEQFPVVGLHKSYANDELITDSAAGATAFACGVKTYNGAIGLAADGTPCKTIVEESEANGLATGLVVTSTIVHATPAAFVAHAKMRELYEEIAADILDTEVDLLIGGGKQYFDRREEDSRNLVDELRRRNYQVQSYDQADINGFKWDPTRNLVYFTADKQPLPVSAGRDYLAFATRQSLHYLEKRSEKGFFLMVEGSQIDWMGHANDGKAAVKEVLDFDRTVQVVLQYARERGNTLVIVTADHETGGMAIMPGSKMNKLEFEFTTNGHTATLIPVFAYGPGAELFAGIYENTAINQKIRQALGFSGASAAVKLSAGK